jgi:MFS superfamily sulfate permease-like transporter
LAGLPTASGLYTTIIPTIFQAFLSTYPYNSFGPAAITALMIGNALLGCVRSIEALYPEIKVQTESLNPLDQYPAIFELNSLLTFAAGIVMSLITLFDLGRFFDPLIPDELIAGFTAGGSISVIVSQLKGLFGIKLPSRTGTFTIYYTIKGIIKSLDQANLASFFVGIGTILLIELLGIVEKYVLKNGKYIKRKFSKLIGKEVDNHSVEVEITKQPKSAFPKVLIAIFVITSITYFGNLMESRNVVIIGFIESGFPKIYYPWKIFRQIPLEILLPTLSLRVPNFFAIILVSYCTLKSVLQNFSYSKIDDLDSVHSLHKESNSSLQIGPSNMEYALVEKGELVTFSVSSIACAFFAGFIPSPSLLRSAILATQTSASSPLANTFSGLIIICAMAFFTKLIALIPLACLSGVIIVALFGTVKKVSNGYLLFQKALERRKYNEFKAAFRWIVTFVFVLVFDPSIGMIIAILSNFFLDCFYKLKKKFGSKL